MYDEALLLEKPEQIDEALAKIESGGIHPEQPGGEIILYQMEDGRTRIQVWM